jgi:uncharacterized membrane protein
MVSFALISKPKSQSTSPAADCSACLICGGRLIDIRGQIHCSQCHAMWDSASDGERMAIAAADSAGNADESNS